MPIVKAKPKANLEDWPEWARCCDKYISIVRGFGEVTVSTSVIEKRSYCGCLYCRAPRPKFQKMILDVSDDTLIPLDLLDLDEGQIIC